MTYISHCALVLGGYVHFNIQIHYWYQCFLNFYIRSEHEYLKVLEMDILSGFIQQLTCFEGILGMIINK
jgi:hypothetical protein